MQVRAFLGPAGCGKTYKLMHEVERLCSISTFQPTQSVLAITFMHGSRRRLAARLQKCSTNGIPTLCETIDSFCLRLVNRFRCYLNKRKPISIQDELKNNRWSEGERGWKTTFRSVRKAAIELLQFTTVRSSIGFTYPIIIVDEFQDCEGELLDLIGFLSLSSSVIIAADGFQHLSKSDTCPACQWLQDQGAEILPLSKNQRTNENLLLETAAALRNGVSANSSIEVFAVDGHGLVAWHISSSLATKKVPLASSKALIVPVRPSSSSWIQGILNSLEKELGQKWKLAPRPFQWESGEEEHYEAALACINGETQCNEIHRNVLHVLEHSDNQIVTMAASQGLRLVSLRGDAGLVTTEFLEILKKTAHSTSVFRHDRQNGRLAMTIHGAKNREFDYVFVAWPYKIQDDNLLKRKLLYNAITRAKKGVKLFVQGGEKRVRDDDVLRLLECGLVKSKKTTSQHRKKKNT